MFMFWIIFLYYTTCLFGQDIQFKRVELNEHPRPETVLVKIYQNDLTTQQNSWKSAKIEGIDVRLKDSFYIDRLDGNLKTTKNCQNVLDREKICQSSYECLLNILILINNSEIFNVEILLVDINDNPPEFKASHQEISIIERRLFNQYFYVPINGAHDPDLQLNSDINYSLNFKDPSYGPFDVFSNATGLYLIVLKDLDYELINRFKIDLLACDAPKSCSTQELLVNVENLNEYPPRFEQETYQVTIKDSHPPLHDIIKLNYFDKDKGVYGRVKFTFVNESNNEYILSHLKIDERTGIIRLLKPLTTPDYYSIRVKVQDSFYKNYSEVLNPMPKAFSSECILVLNVIDTNNFTPTIEIRPSITEETDTTDEYKNSPILWVMENTRAPKTIGYVTVIDRDVGENAQVSCSLIPDAIIKEKIGIDTFDIIFSNSIDAQTSIFKIVMNRPLDAESVFANKSREKHFNSGHYSRHNIGGFIELQLNCSDNGTPKNSIVTPTIIGLLDEDEFQKTFIYNNDGPILVTENLSDIIITQITVHDNDTAPETMFRLLKDSSLELDQEPELDSHFKVDEFSGNIYIRKKLDAELRSEIYLTIGAREKYDKKFDEITRTVKIQILDINDNDPVFVSPSISEKVFGKKYSDVRTVKFAENQPKGTLIIKLKAEDADVDEKGDNLEFFLEKVTPHYTTNYQRNLNTENWPKYRIFFSLNRDGSLFSDLLFDAEEIESFELLIGVRDGGNPSRTSYTLLKVSITDENDERPVWKFPREKDDEVEVDRSTQIGSIITRVNALDLDTSKDYSHVIYSINNIDNRFSDFFTINQDNGDLILAKSLERTPQKIHLSLRACDGNVKKYCIDQILKIHLVESTFTKNQIPMKKFSLFNSSIDGMQNLLALSGGILGGLLFTAVLIGAILLCICRKKKINFLPKNVDKNDKYFEYTVADTKQMNSNTLYTSWLRDTSHPAPSIYQTTPRNSQKIPNNYACTPSIQNSRTNTLGTPVNFLLSSDNQSQGSNHEMNSNQIITAPQEFYYIKQANTSNTSTNGKTASPSIGLTSTEQCFLYPDNIQYTSFDETSPSYQKIFSIPFNQC